MSLPIDVYYTSNIGTTTLESLEVELPNNQESYIKWLKKTHELGFILVGKQIAIPLTNVTRIVWMPNG